MKQKIKSNLAVKGMFLTGLLAASLTGMAQLPSVAADPALGKIVMTDQTGFAVDANDIAANQIISLRIPVQNDGHALPAGSCKIKIGLGSKLVLDPQFNINNTALSNYFKWTVGENSGQVQVTGELISVLPANVTDVNVAFKVKPSKEGKSTITANFLITNHSNNAILSDQDGANNSTSLAYTVTSKVAAVNTDQLQLSLFPNPVKDVKVVTIKVDQGELKGKYNVSLFDMSGKLMQTNQFDLNAVPSFQYKFGTIAAGKYLVKITNGDATQTALLKFEKM
jgi:Secretion system C-terminal sorting domain